MIIIVQKESAKGAYYEFTNLDTGEVRKWYPSKPVKAAEQKQVFEQIARSFEYTAEIGSHGDPLPVSIQPTGDMPLVEFCEKVFLPRKTVTIAENTRDRWTNSLNTRIYPELGQYRMCDLTPAIISDFLLSMQNLGFAQSTVNRYYTILNSIMKMAYMMDLYERNIMEKVERPLYRKDELISSGPGAYTAKEIVRIMDCLEFEPMKYRVMVLLMCETGIRRGECLGIKWDSINFENRSIEIRGCLYYTKDKGVFFDTPKNRRTRLVYISEETAAQLRIMELTNRITVDSEYVFCQDNSPNPMHPTTPTGYFARIGKKYGIDKFHPHKLRHSFASIAITNGADPVSVSEILGHKNTEVMFRNYTNANEQSKRAACDIYHRAIQTAAQEDS